MFSPIKVASKYDLLSLDLIRKSPFDEHGRPLFKPGFHLQEHSIHQVEQANEHLDRVKVRGRKFNVEEIRWIRNERACCSASFLYWATRYAWIVDIEGKLVRFVPNLPQTIILDQLSRMEDDEVAMLIQVLKARQEGVTTLAELILLWRTMFQSYTNSLVASSRPDKSAEMVEKMEICYQNQPFWLVPKIESVTAGEFIGFDKQNSRIHIRHGAMLSGLGRSFTVTTFHLAELAEYLNPKEAIDASLLKGAHDSPWLLGILEGTGKTRSGWWYNKWNFSVEHWPLGESRLCPVFLPWYLMGDLYPTKTWLRGHKIRWQKPEDIPDLVRKHATKAAEYVQSGENKIVTEALGSDWTMPIEQQWWWWVTRMEHESDKTLNNFYRELCANAEEAFQSDNSAIFGPEVIEVFRNNTRIPEGVYGIKASQAEVPVTMQVREADIDPNHPPIAIHSTWGTGASHDYHLYPLLHRGTAPFSPEGKIVLYELPKPGYEYILGTDTGYGLGADSSVIQGLRKGDALRNDEQVFEFASPQLNSYTLWPFNLALGTLYSVRFKDKLRQARQVIEGAANGENVHLELKKRGWNHFHNWVRYDKKKIQEFKANRELWYTTSWSRPLLMDMLLDALNNGWLNINSPWFINEMSELEVIEAGRQKIAAAIGQHDDRIMAMGMALFSAHALETRGRDGWAARRVREGSDIPVYAKYTPGSQGKVTQEYYDSPEPSYRYRVVRNGDQDYEELLGTR